MPSAGGSSVLGGDDRCRPLDRGAPTDRQRQRARGGRVGGRRRDAGRRAPGLAQGERRQAAGRDHRHEEDPGGREPDRCRSRRAEQDESAAARALGVGLQEHQQHGDEQRGEDHLPLPGPGGEEVARQVLVELQAGHLRRLDGGEQEDHRHRQREARAPHAPGAQQPPDREHGQRGDERRDQVVGDVRRAHAGGPRDPAQHPLIRRHRRPEQGREPLVGEQDVAQREAPVLRDPGGRAQVVGVVAVGSDQEQRQHSEPGRPRRGGERAARGRRSRGGGGGTARRRQRAGGREDPQRPDHRPRRAGERERDGGGDRAHRGRGAQRGKTPRVIATPRRGRRRRLATPRRGRRRRLAARRRHSAGKERGGGAGQRPSGIQPEDEARVVGDRPRGEGEHGEVHDRVGGGREPGREARGVHAPPSSASAVRRPTGQGCEARPPSGGTVHPCVGGRRAAAPRASGA